MSNQLELRHLRYFLAVAEELHFRRAAERLFISQPGLSRQIQQLESELGYPLLERNNRRVRLTPAGEHLREEARRLLTQLDAAVRHGRALHDGRAGRLNFGYVGSAMQEIIPSLLLDFRQRFPDVNYGLDALGTQAQVDRLHSRELDIGFMRVDHPPAELTGLPLRADTFSLVLPNDHWLSQENFHSLRQLRRERFILFDPQYSRPYYEQVMALFRGQGFLPEVTHRTVHTTTIYRLVENDFGISIVPSSLRRGYAMRVRFIELTQLPQRSMISAVWRPDNANPALLNFVALLRERYPNPVVVPPH